MTLKKNSQWKLILHDLVYKVQIIRNVCMQAMPIQTTVVLCNLYAQSVTNMIGHLKYSQI